MGETSQAGWVQIPGQPCGTRGTLNELLNLASLASSVKWACVLGAVRERCIKNTARCGAQLGVSARRAGETVAPAVTAEDRHLLCSKHADAQRRNVSHEGHTDSESELPT